MKPYMLRPRYQLQILQAVIIGVFIDMVNQHILLKITVSFYPYQPCFIPPDTVFAFDFCVPVISTFGSWRLPVMRLFALRKCSKVKTFDVPFMSLTVFVTPFLALHLS